MMKNIFNKSLLQVVALSYAALFMSPSQANGFIIVQSTTSTQNSGLYDFLLPYFHESHDFEVRVVAVGTGQAIKNAQNCDGDVLWVHAKEAEQAFVEQGYAKKRHDVMFNDFVLVGPSDDPAGIQGATDVVRALEAIAAGDSVFASRGDDSGTHKKEMKLWGETDLDPLESSGGWYRETGSGMGATLNVAIGMNAYALTDRATWIKFANKGSHTIAVAGDQRLYNQYGIILVDQDKCENLKSALAQQFIDWVLGVEGQSLIGQYQVDGQQLFFPNASVD